MPNSKDTKRNLVCPLAMNERHHHIDDDQNLGESDEERAEESRIETASFGDAIG